MQHEWENMIISLKEKKKDAVRWRCAKEMTESSEIGAVAKITGT